MNQKVRSISVFLSCVVMLVVFFAQAAVAQEMQRAYTENELVKVRNWESTWVGKNIDKSNIDQVAMYFPDSFVGVMKSPDTWALPEGFSFTIRPYEFVPETPNFIAASKANAGKARMAADGSIENLTELAGRLFMNPGEDGLKMAWNFDMQNGGDTAHYRKFSPNINPRTKTDRLADQEQWDMYFVNRTEVDPRPALADNPRGYRSGMFMHMYKPPEFLNTRMYTMRFIDQKKEDDSYIWYNQFRRIRRMSTAQRTDAIDGTNQIYDDDSGWDGQLTRNTYTYKGKKDMFTDRHDGLARVQRNSGQAIVSGLSFERCNLLIVEAVNKDPDYLYSKRIWYLDPETYYIAWTEIYDKQGRMWRLFFNHTQPLRTATGVMKPILVGSHFLDLQRTHSGFNTQQKLGNFEVSISSISKEMFTISNLQRAN